MYDLNNQKMEKKETNALIGISNNDIDHLCIHNKLWAKATQKETILQFICSVFSCYVIKPDIIPVCLHMFQNTVEP